ncbi:MAG: hypothetical protein ACOC3G_09065 [Phycisphaeraceae bacterium]
MTTLHAKAAIAGVQASSREHAMIERGIGYWITPAGGFVPVPPRVSHAELIRELTDPAGLSEADREAFKRDANAFAIDQGWSRVRIYPAEKTCYVDFGREQQAAHRPLIDELLDQLGFAGLTVKYTDEEGNYVS